MAHDRARHGAEAGLAEPVLTPAGEFRRDLVPPRRPAGAAVDERVVVEPERQQHRLFQPLIDFPRRRPLGAVDLLPDTGMARVQQVQCLADGAAHVAMRAGIDIGAVVKGAFDEGLQFGHVPTGGGGAAGLFPLGVRLSMAGPARTHAHVRRSRRNRRRFRPYRFYPSVSPLCAWARTAEWNSLRSLGGPNIGDVKGESSSRTASPAPAGAKPSRPLVANAILHDLRMSGLRIIRRRRRNRCRLLPR